MQCLPLVVDRTEYTTRNHGQRAPDDIGHRTEQGGL